MTALLLADDTAIVTGAARGIGLAIAQALAREGARVLLTDILDEDGEVAARRMMESGAQARFMAADLRDKNASTNLVDYALREFGRVSIFVHCACPPHHGETALDAADDLWDDMLEVNIRAGYRMARLLGQDMRAKKIRGRMLFVTSVHADTPREVPAYSVAKSGMKMLVKELARALGPDGIRVNAIAPGAIADNWFASAEAMGRTIALRRIGKTAEIANMAVAMLAERYSSYLTGATVVVDGGLSLFNAIPQGRN